MKKVIVNTTHGKVMGTATNHSVIFRGIPYGDDCDGAMRFLPPKPAKSWEGIRDCTKNGYYAVQYGTSISGSEYFGEYFNGGNPDVFGVKEELQNENCLVLNVVTPEVDDKKRPVLVYIHGGGFASGSGTLVLGSGKMAEDEDIVVVGINHRLNVFGFLYLGAFDKKYESSGMAGMLDLVLALMWVRDNIEDFGGDPEKVTIMGESGGGMKVGTLLAMPEAYGLFRSAIVESGSNVVGRTSTVEAAEIAKVILERLHILPEHLEALEKLTSNEILEASGNMDGMDNPLMFGPVADNIHLDYQQENRFIASEISKDIPLMVGASEDELAVFLPVEQLNSITWENLGEKLLDINGSQLALGDLQRLTAENIDHVIETFRRADIKNNSADHLFVKIKSLCSFLGGGAWYQACSKAALSGAPVYHYVVAYDSPLPLNSDRKYAWHTADLPLQLGIVLHPESEMLSKIMSRAIGAFVRTGNPSTEALDWPEFDLDSRQVMVFDDVCRVETDPWQKMREICN